MQTLRDFGFGKAGAEATIDEEVQEVIKFLTDQCDSISDCTGPIEPRILITKSVANVIFVLVFGKRLGDDPKFTAMSNIVNSVHSIF